MRDDQDFNIRFVGLIEKYPCLYDNTRDDYHKNNVQEQAWTKIALEIGEGATITTCKGRWRNLRGSYTKYLKKYTPSGSGAIAKRPYYLAEYMAFILPYTKSRPAKGNILAPPTEQVSDVFTEDISSDDDCVDEKEKEIGKNTVNYDVEELFNEEDDQHMFQADFTTSKEPNSLQENNERQLGNNRKTKVIQDLLGDSRTKQRKSIQNRITLDDVNKSAFEYFERKRQRSYRVPNISIYEDADAHFLLSVLPDVKKMTDRQKRSFKMGILTLAGQILDEPTTDINATHSSAATTSSNALTAVDNTSSRSSTTCSHYPSSIEATTLNLSGELFSQQPSIGNSLNLLYDNDL